MPLHMISGHSVPCCDFSNPQFPRVCSLHLNAANLVSALLESEKPLDERVKKELHKCCGHRGAALSDGK